MKKKGAALIYTLVVIILLTAFAMALLVIAVSNRTTTAYLEKSNKLKHAAESGIDVGIEKLKKNIKNDESNENVQFDINFEEPLVDNILFDEDNSIYLSVKAEETTRPDSKLGKEIDCIHLSSTATKDGKKKTVNAYFDERKVGITNDFFDEVFSKPYILNRNTDPILTSKSEKLEGLKRYGNVINFNSVDFANNDQDYDFYSEGIEVAEGDKISRKENKLYILLSDPSINNKTTVNINNLTSYLAGYISGITELSNFPLDEISPYPGSYLGKYMSPVAGPYDKDNYDNIFNTGSKDENYIKSWLYRNILFTNYFKMIVINGDAEINNTFFPLENYIIYCTGDLKVTYDPDNTIKLYNTSIIANNIKVNGTTITDYNDKNKQLSLFAIQDDRSKKEILKYILNLDDGKYKDMFNKEDKNGDILTPKFPSDAWVNLLSKERQNIDNCFNEIFENYWEGYRFRIVEWKESN